MFVLGILLLAVSTSLAAPSVYSAQAQSYYQSDEPHVQHGQKPLEQYLKQQQKVARHALVVDSGLQLHNQPNIFFDGSTGEPAYHRSYVQQPAATQTTVDDSDVVEAAEFGAAPPNPERGEPVVAQSKYAKARINDQETDVDFTSGFVNNWSSDLGIQVSEQGQLTHIGESDVVVSQGQLSHVDDDGHRYSLKYTADQNGFRVEGDHLPTPPPIPIGILRGLEYQKSHPWVEPSSTTEAVVEGQYVEAYN
ncbi:endocuticle structural glycoprotein SgAbd-1-like isoform X1 [Trichogramma pretiosum]|uniref:endocuticle structural glycoprotein SgAbd-1-like isoform X1 n=1 Tax=Trichogramma pretiosum TaxID=7493 RepID=UPI0006C9BB9A|nr:endocuticle structural glycoprotein SgAbd-1-like isoform X1 [Trichogramma pretiosum]